MISESHGSCVLPWKVWYLAPAAAIQQLSCRVQHRPPSCPAQAAFLSRTRIVQPITAPRMHKPARRLDQQKLR